MTGRLRKRSIAAGVAALSTGALLYLAFPHFEIHQLAWVALVPLLAAVRYAEGTRDALRLGFWAGAVFWLSTIWWLTRVTAVGWILLSLYCALYMAVFGAYAYLWLRRIDLDNPLHTLCFSVFAGVGWAALEWIRSTLATGFAWNPLGVSQYRNPAILQPAAWGGVYLVSALIAAVNAAAAVTVLRYIDRRGHWGRRPHIEMMVALLAVAVVFWAGARRVQSLQEGDVPLRAALIQPAIPQYEKWDEAKTDLIYSRLDQLTRAAHRAATPDLVIWPETALPDDVRYSQSSYDLVYNLCALGAPLLVGSMDTEWNEENQPVYFNSSFLFDTEGRPLERYDKQHLVLFGEYIPFHRHLSFLKAMTPIQESFTAGTRPVVFRLEKPPVAFSVLICFEDTVSALARRAVREGARLLVNQTNDAWFDPSSASRQHMAQCVLRVVETGVPALRAANTGVSCYINRRGFVASILANERAEVLFPGFLNVTAYPAPADMPLTVYTRYGDVFAVACSVLSLLASAFLCRRARLNESPSPA